MRRPLLIALLTTAFVLAGCGSSGSDKTSTTSKDAASTTTAGSGSSDDTSTTSKSGGSSVTSAQLEAILPKPADIGPGYTVKKSDSSGTTTTTTPQDADPVDKALEDACPKAKELDLMDEEVNGDEVSVEFETQDDRGFEVALDPTPKGVSADNIDQIIEAFNDCGTVEATDPDMGKITMDLSAEPLEGFGDYGADVRLEASFDLFGTPVKISFHGHLFVVDGVGVSVTATSGIDPSTFKVVPPQDELLDPVSTEMEKRVSSL